MSRSVLIIRFSAIGDCVMAAQAVSAVRRQNPTDQIVWAVDPRCGDVIDTESLVQERFDVPRERWKKGGADSSTISQLRHFAKLRKYKFDYGADLQGHSKTAICLRLSGAKRRLTIPAQDPGAWLLHPLPANVRGIRHETEIFRKVLEPLGLGPDAPPIMPQLLEERALVRSWVDSSKPLATIAISAGHRKKVYPIDGWTAVAGALVAEGFQVAFLGGPSDPSPAAEKTFNWVGKLKLSQTMAAVAESTIHLAADTGTGHIAGAYGIPLVSIFGWSDPARFAPRGPRVRVLDAGHNMDELAPEKVVQAAASLLEGACE